MKVLILSCNTGGGHNSAGKAIAEELLARGDEAYVLDYLRLAGDGVSRLVGDGYVQLVKKTPKLFGLVYNLGLVVSRITRKSPVYYVNGRMAKYLDRYLKEHPVDAIVMPHLYPAETITRMRRKGMSLPLTVAVMTDYTCIPFWEETDCDYYVTPHERLHRACVRRGLPEEKLIPLGIPVSRAFSQEISREEARARLGLSLDEKYLLVVGGSMGAGDLEKLVDYLLKESDRERILIICGSNEKMEQKLKKQYGGETRVRVKGFTSRMPLYLKACDLVFTKPGGLTSTEAAVAGIPLVHTEPIPGCETANRKFFTGLGMSVSALTTRGQVQQGLKLLQDPRRAERMYNCQRENIRQDSAKQICDFLYKKLAENQKLDAGGEPRITTGGALDEMEG